MCIHQRLRGLRQVDGRVGLAGGRQGAHGFGLHDKAVAAFRVFALIDQLAQRGRQAPAGAGLGLALAVGAQEHHARGHQSTPAADARAARPGLAGWAGGTGGTAPTAGRAAIQASTSVSRHATLVPCSCTALGKSAAFTLA
jgi:hypothetical protein